MIDPCSTARPKMGKDERKTKKLDISPMSAKSLGDGGVPILDPQALAQLREFGEDCIVEIVNLYLAELTSRLVEMRSAITRGDAAGLRESAHALKGGCGNVGALGMMTLCQKLESAAQIGEFWSAPHLVDLIAREATRVRAALGSRS
jgi:HPt (histidine-containing phosphotransfer) domain-containing protein